MATILLQLSFKFKNILVKLQELLKKIDFFK